MKTFPQDRSPIKGWPIFFVALFILLIILLDYAQRPRPQIVHTLGPSTLDAKVLWQIQEVFVEPTCNESGIIYAEPISTDSLMAINSSDGATLWEINLPLERGGARELLSNRDTVFVTTSTFMDAYDTSTSGLKWSTKLGDGHTTVISQIEDGMLIVYYGNKLIEINPEIGKIISAKPKGATSWISGNAILQSVTINQWKATDKKTGEMLWEYPPGEFYIDEGKEPKDIGNGKLIVSSMDGICLLDLYAGKFEWCKPEIRISNIAIDSESQVGFAMQNNTYTLVVIDLQTGAVLGEVHFLSSGPINEQILYPDSIIHCNGVVMISFPDSGQTFGLKFNDIDLKN